MSRTDAQNGLDFHFNIITNSAILVCSGQRFLISLHIRLKLNEGLHAEAEGGGALGASAPPLLDLREGHV